MHCRLSITVGFLAFALGAIGCSKGPDVRAPRTVDIECAIWRTCCGAPMCVTPEEREELDTGDGPLVACDCDETDTALPSDCKWTESTQDCSWEAEEG